MSAPDLDAAARAFADLCATIARLRDPKDGCPWDLAQDHESLRRYMIEEAYEAAHAMADQDPATLRDELGDVLLQVVLNAQIAYDSRTFSVADVIRGIDDKMRRRHPHVFAGAEARETGLTSDQVRRNWDVIKAEEKAAKPAGARSFFAAAEGKGPATLQAYEIGRLAARLRFDWDGPDEVLEQVRSEIDEVREALARGGSPADLAEEIGDVYFSLAQLCRHLKFDPEIVAVDANRKFLRRFAALERLALARGLDPARATRDQLEQLWKDVKAAE